MHFKILKERRSQLENDKLIESYFENDELKIKEIVNEYSKYVFTIIQNLSKNILSNDDIEESISDVFLQFGKGKIDLIVNIQ